MRRPRTLGAVTATDSEGPSLELHQMVLSEWEEDHRLSRSSLLWIHEHADADDPHPVATAVAMLRATVTEIDTAKPAPVIPTL